MIRGKRGLTNIQFFTIAESVLAVIVFIALLSYIQGLATDSLFEQNFLARDAALVIDSAYAAPGELSIVYDVSVAENKILFIPKFSAETRFRFAFDNSRVFVFRNSYGDLYQKPASYLFGEDQKIKLVLPEQADVKMLEKGGAAGAYKAPDIKKNILLKKSGSEFSIEFTELSGENPGAGKQNE